MTTIRAFKTAEGKAAVMEIYDSVLARWSGPNEKLYVDTCFGSTFVIANGNKEAPPLILLHGSAMNSAMWMADAKEYSQDYRVYAVDIPGEPGKSDERQLPFEGPAFARWLHDVYLGLGLNKASIVGISLGGWLAVKFAISYPELVDKLVLLAPAGIGKQKLSFLFRAMLHMPFGEKGMRRLYKMVNGNQPIPEEVLKYQVLIGKSFNFRREIIPLFTDEELGKVNVPVILFVGEKDVMIHSEITAERIKKRVPQAEVNVRKGAPHALIDLKDRIAAFLEK